MTAPSQTHSAQVSQLVRTIKKQWDQGEQPNTLAVLERYPDLRDDTFAVRDLAYAEFWLRKTDGEEMDADAFCALFPDVQTSLRSMLLWADMVGYDLDLFHEDALLSSDGPAAAKAPRTCRRKLLPTPPPRSGKARWRATASAT